MKLDEPGFSTAFNLFTVEQPGATMPAVAKLTQSGGSRVCQLTKRTLIGRSSICALMLTHTYVSREHAVMSWSGNIWKLRDLGSRNGTFVGSHQLSPGEDHVLESVSLASSSSLESVLGSSVDETEWGSENQAERANARTAAEVDVPNFDGVTTRRL